MPDPIMSPMGMTRLCVTIGYDNNNIARALTGVYGLTEIDARDMIARVREVTLSAEECLSTTDDM